MFEPSKLFEVIGEPLPTGRLKKEGDGGATWADPFIAWLESKDPREGYDPVSTTACLVCQYASHVAGEKMNWGDAVSFLNFKEGGPLDFAAHDDGFVPKGSPRATFGAALTRAQAALERLS